MQLIPFSPILGAQLAPFFTNDRPVAIRLWAMLEGQIASRILVDDLNSPRLALVQEHAEGTTYIGGAATPEQLAEGIAQLRRHQDVVVCAWPDEPLAAMLPSSPDYDGVAIDFTDQTPAIDLDQLASVTAPYQMRRIDHDLAPLLHGFDYYVAMYGSIKLALEQTIGYCIMQGAAVVSEAVAGPLARGMAEIGVGTQESHRGKGLATAVSAKIVQECKAQGYRAFWNASSQNLASLALARRLGFQTEQPFRVLVWSSLNMK